MKKIFDVCSHSAFILVFLVSGMQERIFMTAMTNQTLISVG